MALFVLLPGAWLIGDIFESVVHRLLLEGHWCRAVTYPGLVDDGGGEPDLESWIAAGVQAVDEANDQVFLIGHSFSGIVAGAVADRVPDRVGHLVYLDANLPVNGESFADSWTSAGQQWLRDQISSNPDGRWAPDLDQKDTQLDDGQQAVLMRHAFPMPSPPLFQPVTLSDKLDSSIPTTYVLCTRARTELPSLVADRAQRSGWEVRHLDAGHWPMVSHPQEVASMLHDMQACRQDLDRSATT